MKLVCDTNVVFSALIAGGKTRELILNDQIDLYAPEYFFTELRNHRDEIREKSKLSDDQLTYLRTVLFKDVRVVPKQEFDDRLETASQLIGDTDPDDIPFLALALHLNADLWSDDTDFEDQDAVTTWKTHDLVVHILE
ncbi:MAG: PIN domain-containing protein [Candidatus Nanohaloarchaeota archaeon QJJ-5]|nr:PIN domain-containing protein [Candidatus Nanohaloarchaeota archaeon QJJ-5]